MDGWKFVQIDTSDYLRPVVASNPIHNNNNRNSNPNSC